MKKKVFLSSLACGAVFLSPLVLTGCQAVGEFFGQSAPVYQGPVSQGQPSSYSRGSRSSAAHSTHSSSSEAVAPTVYKGKHKSSTSVPIEPPSVSTSAPSVPSVSSTTSAPSSPSPSEGSNPAAPAPVPAAPTVVPAPPPAMPAPTISQ